MELSEEVLRGRQTWFWRRTTLQVVLGVLCAILAVQVAKTATLNGDWPTTVVTLALIAAVAWLVTMYFAMVDNANKVVAVVNQIGESVGEARGKPDA